MMTESELFSSAFVSFVFLYQENYQRLPHLHTYNRVECDQMPHVVYNMKLESGISWEKIEFREMNHNILIENRGTMSQSEFVINHQERYTEIRFNNYHSRFKLEENGHVYYATLESSDEVKIETEQYPRATYNFTFS